MLVQKTTTIQLPQPARVRKLICVDISTILIITAKNILVYDIITNLQLSNANIQNWQIKGTNLQEDTLSILEAVFHPKLQQIFLLLSRNLTDKHKNWIFISTSLTQTKTLASPVTLLSFEDSLTRYQKMELQPRIIIFPQSDYFALLRQFYNDSMIVIFQHGAQVTSFFANQQNMTEFDEIKTLVSFRALFEGRIVFELFDIEPDQKQKQKKQERKVSTKLQANVNKSGVVVAIKKISKKSKKPVPHEQNSQLFNTTGQLKQSSLAVLAVNWRNKSIEYIVYDFKSSQILSIASNIKQSALLASFFTITSERKICALLFKQGKLSLVYENCSISTQNTKCDYQLYQSNQQLQDWDFYKMNEKDFIVINYSQPLNNQQLINCHVFRNMERKETIVRLAMEKNIGEGLLETILSLYHE